MSHAARNCFIALSLLITFISSAAIAAQGEPEKRKAEAPDPTFPVGTEAGPAPTRQQVRRERESAEIFQGGAEAHAADALSTSNDPDRRREHFQKSREYADLSNEAAGRASSSQVDLEQSKASLYEIGAGSTEAALAKTAAGNAENAVIDTQIKLINEGIFSLSE